MSPAAVAGTLPPHVKTPAHLESCMKRALSAINKTSLEPPLTAADIDPEILADIKPAASPPDDFYRNALESAHKNILYEIATQRDPSDKETTLAFGNLLDFALISAELEIADPGLPLSLMEDLFDTQTIPSAERLFEYLESRVERITSGMEGGKGKALVLLRLCNELLRRLSKAEDTIFCGRILIFLSKSFPIAERSAVNLRGDFNVENVTVFEDIPREETPPAEEKMDVDTQPQEDTKPSDVGKKPGENGVKTPEAAKESEKSPKEGSKKEETVNGKPGKTVKFEAERPVMDTKKLYPMFWALQHDFSDPTRLFDSANFEKFKKGLQATMAKFSQAENDGVKTSGSSAAKPDHARNGISKQSQDDKKSNLVAGEKRKRDDGLQIEGLKAEVFNPKYLTSPELFELEIRDLTFRRHVLVQAMILLDFLLSLTPANKEKWKLPSMSNRSVQYSFTLSPEDEKWCNKTKSDIQISLQQEHQGRQFVRLINTVLSREQNWVAWKAEGCHPFDKPPLSPEDFQDARTKAKGLKDWSSGRPYPFTMGTPALNTLWGQTGPKIDLESLKNKSRHTLPTVQSIVDDFKRDDLDLDFATTPAEQEEVHNAKKIKTWKAFRIASGRTFHIFKDFDEHATDADMMDAVANPPPPSAAEKPKTGGAGAGTTDATAAAAAGAPAVATTTATGTPEPGKKSAET